MINDEFYRENISRRYLELSESNDKDLQEIVLLASEICETPIALITLLDRNKQYFKAKTGIEVTGTERKVAFCNYTVQQDELFVVKDATSDERFKDNPLVTDALNLQFYAGYPLKSPSGINVGSLCVIDHVPRELTPFQKNCLAILSKQVIQRLELGLSLQILREDTEKLQRQKEIIDQSAVMLQAFFDDPFEYQVFLNTKLEIVAVNKAAKELYRQFANKDLRPGENIINFLPPEISKDFKAIVPVVLNGGTLNDERIIKSDNSEGFWIRLTITPALNADNEVIGIAVIGYDNNLIKKQEEKINNQHHTLSQIAQWHSHELRQPVSSILALVNLIREDNSAFRNDYLNNLETVARQLDALIRDIVAESRSV